MQIEGCDRDFVMCGVIAYLGKLHGNVFRYLKLISDDQEEGTEKPRWICKLV
jgi:hypothetical protein